MKVIEKTGELTDLVCIEYDPLGLLGNNFALRTKEGACIYSRRAPLNLQIYGDVKDGKNIKVTILRRRSDDSGLFPNKWEFEHVKDCGWSNNIKRPVNADGTGSQLIAFFQDAFIVQDEKDDWYVFYDTDYIVDKIEVVEEDRE